MEKPISTPEESINTGNSSTDGQATEASESSRNILLLAYLMYGLGMFALLPVIIGVIINHIKIEESRNNRFLFSHHRWLMRTFYISLLFFFVCLTLSWIPFGWVTWPMLWTWVLYRIVRGVLAFLENKSLPTLDNG